MLTEKSREKKGARAYLVEDREPRLHHDACKDRRWRSARLHPEFAVRAGTTRSARLGSAGAAVRKRVFRPLSGRRPIRRRAAFSNKFNSLHTYGLAVDMRGIGTPRIGRSGSYGTTSPPKKRRGWCVPYGPARTGAGMESLPAHECEK